MNMGRKNGPKKQWEKSAAIVTNLLQSISYKSCVHHVTLIRIAKRRFAFCADSVFYFMIFSPSFFLLCAVAAAFANVVIIVNTELEFDPITLAY